MTILNPLMVVFLQTRDQIETILDSSEESSRGCSLASDSRPGYNVNRSADRSETISWSRRQPLAAGLTPLLSEPSTSGWLRLWRQAMAAAVGAAGTSLSGPSCPSTPVTTASAFTALKARFLLGPGKGRADGGGGGGPSAAPTCQPEGAAHPGHPAADRANAMTAGWSWATWQQ